MVDTVQIFYIFDRPVDRRTIRSAVSFCARTAEPNGDRTDVDALVAALVDERESLAFLYEDVHVHLRSDRDVEFLPDMPTLALRVDDVYFRYNELNEKDDILAHSGQLVEFVAGLYEHLVDEARRPHYVYGFGPADVEVLTDPNLDESISKDGVLDHRLEFVGWLQILPPAMLSDADEDAVLSTPAWRVERLSDGGLLVVTERTPTMIEANYHLHKIEAHLSEHL